MKALLVTRCGCSRMTETDGGLRWHIPLIAHYDKGLFRSDDPAINAIEWWGHPAKRTFEREHRNTFKMPNGEECAYYREVAS